MMRAWRAATAVTAAVTLIVLAGCTGDGDESSEPEDSTSGSSSATAEPTTAPSLDTYAPEDPTAYPEDWESDFTPDQVDVIAAALQRYTEFSELRNEIYASGEDTEANRAVFTEYSALAAEDIATLTEVYAQGGVRQEVAPEVLWTYGEAVSDSLVQFVQCTDFTDQVVTQDGVELTNKPTHLITPVQITMEKNDAGEWLWSGEQIPDVESCDP